ncbi:hypothetical protein [Thorsellia anophelis]|nr:hypothetical protein [Thorsellia anophelis]
MAEWATDQEFRKVISSPEPNYDRGKEFFVTVRMARKQGDPTLYLVDRYADYHIGRLDMGLRVKIEQTKTGRSYDTDFP